MKTKAAAERGAIIIRAALLEVGHPAADHVRIETTRRGFGVTIRAVGDATARRRAYALAALASGGTMRCIYHGRSSRSDERCGRIDARDVLQGRDEPCELVP